MKKDIFIGVCYPSRGTGHDPTFAGIQREIEPYPHARPYFFAFYEPLPKAHNTVTRLALADRRVTHLWFLENDHLLPVGILPSMLQAMEDEDAPVVSGNYLFRGGSGPIASRKGDRVTMVPTGCLLVRREVFSLLPDPPFKTTGRHTHRLDDEEAWGDTGRDGQAAGDVYFSRMCLERGIRMAVVDDPQVGHLELVEAGQHTINGLDHIRLWGGTGELPHAPPPYLASLPEMVTLSPPRGGGEMQIESRYARKWIKRGWKVIATSRDDPEEVESDDGGTVAARKRALGRDGVLVSPLPRDAAQAAAGDGHGTAVRPEVAPPRLGAHPQSGVRPAPQSAAGAGSGVLAEDAAEVPRVVKLPRPKRATVKKP